MKRMMFGLGLLLSGVIGFVGWSIAAVHTVSIGSRRSVFGCFDKIDGMVLIVFITIAIVGLIISFKEYENN